MRQDFSRQLQLDCIAISEIQMNLNCRDEMIPILRGDDQKNEPAMLALSFDGSG